MRRASHNQFKTEHFSTIGCEFGTFYCNTKEKVLKFQIWDAAGEKSFQSVTKIFFKNAHVIFLCFDIGNEESFRSCSSWLNQVTDPLCIIYLVGTKSDQPRQVEFPRALEFARSQKIAKYFETSAKTGESVQDLFSCAIKEVHQRYEELPLSTLQTEESRLDTIQSDEEMEFGSETESERIRPR